MSKMKPFLVWYLPLFAVTGRWLANVVLITVVIALAGCDRPSKEKSISGGSGTIDAINHTHWAINHFSVDGQSGLDIIGPWQGGGGGCCYGVPEKWTPELKVKVEWETGVAFAEDAPEIPEPERPDAKATYRVWQAYSDKKEEWYEKLKALNSVHTQVAPVPDYTGQKTCGIKIHFLPCEQIKVTTSCYDYGNPQYPIKDPIRMKEPKVCPK